MGTEITPELLSQIQSKKLTNSTNKITNENKFAKKIEKPKIKEIITDIYSPHIKKKENINIENNIIDNAVDVKQKEDDLNLNHIFFQKHKSFDLSYNFYKKNEIMNSNKIFENSNDELNSEKNNESIISDYADISQDMLNFNNNNKKGIEKSKNKEINAKKIRDKYYNKLITKLEWNPFKKEKIINNLFFFDWDDTLLCTSYLQPTGALIDMEINKRDKDIISDLDSLVSKLLLKTMNIGIVFIVTNGAPGWVELSSTKYYPKTSKILQKIKVISARGLCERKYPGDIRQWKKIAFEYALETLEDINKNIVTNILCMGDSNMEMEAAYYLKECFPNAYLKTIKFKECPTHIELEKELKIINTQFDSIIRDFNKNFGIKVIRKKNE